MSQAAGTRRVRVKADRGFADVVLCDLFTELGVALIIRVKRGTMVCLDGSWRCRYAAVEACSSEGMTISSA